jgi:hypothetical protein
LVVSKRTIESGERKNKITKQDEHKDTSDFVSRGLVPNNLLPVEESM